jgi:UDPglucose 6-dehydrogenase
MEINYDQRKRVLNKLREILGNFRGRTIGLLGLSFKPNTDDMRDAPSIELAHMLENEGAHIKVYDPVAMPNAKKILKTVTYCDTPYAVAEDADAVILVTEWNEFKQLDMQRIVKSMRQPVLFDARNIYDPSKMKVLGFQYRGVGRGYDANGQPA